MFFCGNSVPNPDNGFDPALEQAHDLLTSSFFSAVPLRAVPVRVSFRFPLASEMSNVT